ncbi:MAG: hypothetical protein DHS20C10_01860 [marine bacterium B5-7]|nr:MAG: hypothetical protein DHS20C10_01860 [marine bacterium B5-7]
MPPKEETSYWLAQLWQDVKKRWRFDHAPRYDVTRQDSKPGRQNGSIMQTTFFREITAISLPFIRVSRPSLLTRFFRWAFRRKTFGKRDALLNDLNTVLGLKKDRTLHAKQAVLRILLAHKKGETGWAWPGRWKLAKLLKPIYKQHFKNDEINTSKKITALIAATAEEIKKSEEARFERRKAAAEGGLSVVSMMSITSMNHESLTADILREISTSSGNGISLGVINEVSAARVHQCVKEDPNSDTNSDSSEDSSPASTLSSPRKASSPPISANNPKPVRRTLSGAASDIETFLSAADPNLNIQEFSSAIPVNQPPH